jgi:hypothetical protein
MREGAKMSGRTLKIVMVVIIGAGALAGTHGLAFWLGGRDTKARVGVYVRDLMGSREEDELRTRLAGLKILANHASQIPPDEVKTYCMYTESLAGSVEHYAATLRQAGNDPEADRREQLVADARKEVARLQRRGR